MVLDLLRVVPEDLGAAPIKALVEKGELFGFEGNAVRVAVARLLRSGVLESDERGWYRMSPRTDPMRDLAESWRLGDKRIRPWEGRWIGLGFPRLKTKKDRNESVRALSFLGFAKGLEGLWVRPDNLAEPKEKTAERLDSLGLAWTPELLVLSELSPTLDTKWRNELWPTRSLLATYRFCLQELLRSSTKLESMPRDQALQETFLMGGAVIRVLSLDPLLPDEVLPGGERRRLHEVFVEYEAGGWRFWKETLSMIKRQNVSWDLAIESTADNRSHGAVRPASPEKNDSKEGQT